MAYDSKELELVLRDHAIQHGVPGAAAGVLVDGEIITACYGVTSVEHPLDVTPSTLFQACSITKTFTSAAVMLLVGEGRVGLDDAVSKHLPDLGERIGIDLDEVTVEHLLSHRAGFDGDRLMTARASTLDALRGARVLFAPGEGFSYNNAAFSIAGELITAIAGQPYESFVRDRLLRPLGMDTACFTADEAITQRVAIPHAVLGGNQFVVRGLGPHPGWHFAPSDAPAGGLLASLEHLLAWGRFQLTGEARDGKVLLNQESLKRMHTPVVSVDQTMDIALDWFVSETDGVTAISHLGNTIGYDTDIVVIPERGVGVVCLTHATNGAAVNQGVRRWALQRFAGIDERDPAPDPSLAVETSRFTGNYLHGFANLKLAAGEAEGTVVLTHSPRNDLAWTIPIELPPVTFGFFAEDQAVSLDFQGPAMVVKFGFGQDGRAEWLLAALRRSPRID